MGAKLGGRVCQALLDVGVDPNGADAEPDAICFQRPTWKHRVGAGEVIAAANGSVTVVDQRILFGKFAGATDTVTFRDTRGRAVAFLREGTSFLIPLDNRLPTQVTLKSKRGLATCRITWFHGIEALPLCDTVVYHSR